MNEPSRVALIAEAIAKEKELPLQKIKDVTTKNAKALFNI
jgi:Tat protein secretion system quality control protein TatD with DNase activity